MIFRKPRAGKDRPGMPSHLRIGRDTFHYKWAKSHKPAMTIGDGDTVTFEINDVASWQLTEDSKSRDIDRLDASKLYPLAGPVLRRGCEAGDALIVETVSVKDRRLRLVGDNAWLRAAGGVQAAVPLQVEAEGQEVRDVREWDQDPDPAILRGARGRATRRRVPSTSCLRGSTAGTWTSGT